MTDIDRDILKAMQDLTVALGRLTNAVEALQAEVGAIPKQLYSVEMVRYLDNILPLRHN